MLVHDKAVLLARCYGGGDGGFPPKKHSARIRHLQLLLAAGGPKQLLRPWTDNLFSDLYGEESSTEPSDMRVYYALPNERSPSRNNNSSSSQMNFRIIPSERADELTARIVAHNALFGCDAGQGPLQTVRPLLRFPVPGGEYDLSSSATDVVEAEPFLADHTVQNSSYSGPLLCPRAIPGETLCVDGAAKNAEEYNSLYKTTEKYSDPEEAKRLIKTMYPEHTRTKSTAKRRAALKMWDKIQAKREQWMEMEKRAALRGRRAQLVLKTNYSEKFFRRVCTPKRVLCYQIQSPGLVLPAEWWGEYHHPGTHRLGVVSGGTRSGGSAGNNTSERIENTVQRLLGEKKPFRVSASMLNPSSSFYSPTLAQWAATSPVFLYLLATIRKEQAQMRAALARSPHDVFAFRARGSGGGMHQRE